MTELGKSLGEWLGRGLVETTEDLFEALDANAADGAAAATPTKASAADAATRAPAPPKASGSWFGKASKHCSLCGKASVKVERPACKGCGSTEWNFEGVVDTSEQGFLAKAQANATSRAKMMNTMEGSDEPGDQVIKGDVSEALSALNAMYAQRHAAAGMDRAYELRGVHFGSGVCESVSVYVCLSVCVRLSLSLSLSLCEWRMHPTHTHRVSE